MRSASTVDLIDTLARLDVRWSITVPITTTTAVDDEAAPVGRYGTSGQLQRWIEA